jgi:hypothetical protein
MSTYGEMPMAERNDLQSTTQTQMRDWETEIKELKVKLHSARPLDKIRYYGKIKALQAKLAAGRKRDVRKQETKE